MKKMRVFMITMLVTIGFCSTLIYTSSCKKSTCSGVVCQNGGSCNNGSCTCPSGYSGTNCQTATTSNVAYMNNTFTPVTIVINGSLATIPAGATVSFKGNYGTLASGTATTSGSTPLGVLSGGGSVGQSIYWQLNNKFPVSGTVTDTLNVGASYFYLSIVNNSTFSIINYTVNSELVSGAFAVTASIPNNGQTYGLGYYLAYPNSNVKVTYSDGHTATLSSFSLPFANNQQYTASF